MHPTAMPAVNAETRAHQISDDDGLDALSIRNSWGVNSSLRRRINGLRSEFTRCFDARMAPAEIRHFGVWRFYIITIIGRSLGSRAIPYFSMLIKEAETLL